MLSFNSTTVKAVKFTGKDTSGTQVTNKSLTDVICNGTHIWCTPPSIGTSYDILKMGTSGSGYTYAIQFRLVNNSTRSVSYKNQVGVDRSTTTSLTAGQDTLISINFGSTVPLTNKYTVSITYLGETVSAALLYNTTILRA